MSRFQPARTPLPGLGTLQLLDTIPPVFDVWRYGRETQGCVDYMLFQGEGEFRAGRTLEEFVQAMYRDKVAGCSVVRSPVGARGSLQLYQRNSACSENAGGTP